MLYQAAFVMCRPILSDDDKALLHWLDSLLPLDKFKADVRNYEEMAVDFVYTSAKIEGNTYDRVDTDNLLRLGITAGGKRYSDAIMLVNLREGFASAMSAEHDTKFDQDYLGDLHKTLMRDLLPVNEQGLGRTSPVTIGASQYRPLSDPKQLRSELKFILEEADKYVDPFEQSIYLHCSLAYLQYFRDGNKRTSRLMQTAALVRGNKLPLFFNDTLIGKYQRATVNFYETGEYGPYVDFFKENHTLAVAHLLGREPEDLLSEFVGEIQSGARAARQFPPPRE
jgi:Fic family protein